ncbi:MAG: hypothetical protein ABJA78_17625 [Ferruginibacter sp.]
MADNINDDTLENPISPQQENAAEENLNTIDADIITPIQGTENMEVHHHPDLHHKPKKWKEYFLEFLMIFLAVSLGFIAENIREHLSDNSKEKEYIESLVEDLKIDQQILSKNIAQLQSGILMMDSMITILDNPSQILNNTGDLYYLARLSPRLQPLLINDKTFEQLKNSGNFRLIKNISTSNKIMDYYKKLPLVQLLESINETEFTQYKSVAAKIFNPEIFISTEGNGNELKKIIGNPPLRTTDNELLQELSIFAVYMHGTKKGVLNSEEEIKNAGAKLIDYLQKEYHLE